MPPVKTTKPKWRPCLERRGRLHCVSHALPRTAAPFHCPAALGNLVLLLQECGMVRGSHQLSGDLDLTGLFHPTSRQPQVCGDGADRRPSPWPVLSSREEHWRLSSLLLSSPSPNACCTSPLLPCPFSHPISVGPSVHLILRSKCAAEPQFSGELQDSSVAPAWAVLREGFEVGKDPESSQHMV